MAPRKGYKQTPEHVEKMRLTKIGKKLGKDNPMWKGDNIGYAAIHIWLQVNFGVASKCEALDCVGASQHYEWALLKGKTHQRRRENYQEMCVSCHRKYDMTDETRRKIGLAAKGNTYSRGKTWTLPYKRISPKRKKTE